MAGKAPNLVGIILGGEQGAVEMRQARSATRLLAVALVGSAIALAACGDGGGTDPSSEPGSAEEGAVPDQGCAEVEMVEVLPSGNHDDRDFSASDYETNPPAGGDHNPTPLEFGQFYTDPPRLGEAVHALEHGGIIGWTNDLSEDDREAVEAAFNRVFSTGYPALAVVENPELDVPFALSAWGAIQKCGSVDGAVVEPFVESNYASDRTGEGQLACAGARAPSCPGNSE